MKKIISISVWGNNPRYIVGAHRQVQLAQKYLPDWDFRIYTDNPSNFKALHQTQIVKCDNPVQGAYWRFFAMFDDVYDVVASRDADSRVTLRECKAMQEFCDSDKIFHVIRDHESHLQFPIMAGLFACKGSLPSFIKEEMLAYMSKHTQYLSDQNFLRDFVWRQVKDRTLIHSFESGWFGESRAKLKNRFSFCGNGYDENDMPLYPPTLVECAGFDPKTVEVKYEFDVGQLYD